MKTNQEILDFYGVELNKIYKRKDEEAYFKIGINKVNNLMVIYSEFVNEVDEVESDCIYDRSNSYCTKAAFFSILALNNWNYEEYKRPILDEKEHEYLSFVLRPFREKIRSICKFHIPRDCECIRIMFDNYFALDFPYFKEGLMYKGMQTGKDYTLEELGL